MKNLGRSQKFLLEAMEPDIGFSLGWISETLYGSRAATFQARARVCCDRLVRRGLLLHGSNCGGDFYTLAEGAER